MKQIERDLKPMERDLVAFFNALWYRDFPLAKERKTPASRAEWTTHIGICIRTIADLMGYFTHFEGGIKTDAVLKNNSGKPIANVEWEWYQPINEKVNEIQKLYETQKDIQMSVFIGYYDAEREKENIQKIKKIWKCNDKTLIAFLVKFHKAKWKLREFERLETWLFRGGKEPDKHRSQAALPWMLEGTRWEREIDS